MGVQEVSDWCKLARRSKLSDLSSNNYLTKITASLSLFYTGKTPSGRMYDINIDGEMHPVTGPEGAAVGNSYLYIEASAKTAGQLARCVIYIKTGSH